MEFLIFSVLKIIVSCIKAFPAGKGGTPLGVTEEGHPAGVTAPKAQPLPPPCGGTLPKGEGLRLRR